MAEFKRENPLFSMCGLNCGLCSMKLGGYCPGCGQGNRPCRTARCGMGHSVEYCFQCGEYPCELCEHDDEYDSFITHKNRRADSEKARRIGVEAYNAEQAEKALLLNRLLTEYNSGREKTLYCIAANLLEIEDIKGALEKAEAMSGERSIKEKAAFVSDLLRKLAQERKTELKLRKKVHGSAGQTDGEVKGL